MVAAGENQNPGNKYIGGRIGYAAGPVNVAAAFGRTQTTFVRDMTAFNIAGSFNLGFLTLYGQYHKYKVDTPTVDQKNMLIGVTVPVGAGTIKASYGSVSSAGTANDAKQYAVGYVYDMSKRTALYTAFSKISNGNGARFAVATAQSLSPQNGSPAFSGTSASPSSTGYEFGVRHSF
jgi:predicted porin